MRYKNNVLDRLVQLEGTVNNIQVQVNRGTTQQNLLNTVEKLKSQIEGIREMISVEPDDFEQQFKG